MCKSKALWVKTHRELLRAAQRRYRAKLRHDAITAYGGACYDCGTTREEVIEFDHQDGHGNEHRNKVFGYGHASPGGWNFYLYLKKLGYPKDIGIALRCVDCHDLKHPERVGKERRGAPSQSHNDMFATFSPDTALGKVREAVADAYRDKIDADMTRLLDNEDKVPF
jgi:hypothetical protein